ncbi:hypothetical protein V8E55_009140 [Tylopilus felleus]
MTYLNEHRSEQAEGAFRKPTLHGCAQYVNTNGDHQGKAKDVQAVRGKFKAMKEYYTVIKAWTRKSGVHYDNTNGANIQDVESAKVFDAWVCEKGHSKMKGFCNKGWGYFKTMEEIFPEGVSTGNTSWHGSSGTLGLQSSTQPVPSTSSPSHASNAAVTSHAAVVGAAATHQLTALPLPHHTTSSTTTSPSVSTDPMKATPPPLLPPLCFQLLFKSLWKAHRLPFLLAVREEEQRNQLIMINSVQNTISGLHDTLFSTFRDELTIVHDASKVLYLIPSFANDPQKLIALGEIFADKENVKKASFFLSLKDSPSAGHNVSQD